MLRRAVIPGADSSCWLDLKYYISVSASSGLGGAIGIRRFVYDGVLGEHPAPHECAFDHDECQDEGRARDEEGYGEPGVAARREKLILSPLPWPECAQ